MTYRILFFLPLLFTACAPNRVEQLSERANTYNRSLRWQSLTAAGTLVADESRRGVMEALADDMNRNKIIDYAIVDLGLDEKKATGSVMVEFSYVGLNDQELRYRQEIQSWTYDPKKKNWYLKEARDAAARR